jgi:Cd2+/Zn2+-exporting ATPase/Cu+-exporting ATPase
MTSGEASGGDQTTHLVLKRQDVARIAFVAAMAGLTWLGAGEPGRVTVIFVGLSGLLVGGWPIFSEAAENLAAGRMTMELSMSLAILAAAAIQEFVTALVITLFALVAEVLEGMTVSRGRRAIRRLLDVLPRVVTVRAPGGSREVPAEALRVGDSVLVSPGSLVPVDGTVVGGYSFVDQASVTGESMPAEKVSGSAVYAGTINQSGALEIRAEHLGNDTSYGKIIDAVERAEHSRAPVERLADRLASYLVYLALAASAINFLVTRDVRSTIAVVIVAGACGVAAGTPLAILGGIGRAARLGTIIKGGLHLETLGRVDTVVLDKTGTLTFGRPQVGAVMPIVGISETEIIDAAAAAELRSEHPIGKAIVACARALGLSILEPERFDYTPGLGVRAVVAGATVLVGNAVLLSAGGVQVPPSAEFDSEGGSQALVARNGCFLGAIVVEDTVRPEARRAMEAMRRLGIRILLLTGDSLPAAEATARKLGIEEFEAGLLPQNKVTRVKDLVKAGRVVAMLGDGVNDAPALAEADVGIAMGSGTEVARENADAVLIGDLLTFTETVSIARWTRRIIWQNFVGTIAVDLIGIAFAAAGLISPLVAAFIHVTSELAFISNSARLLPGEWGRSAVRPASQPRSCGCDERNYRAEAKRACSAPGV